MTPEELERLAREAGLERNRGIWTSEQADGVEPEDLARFAALVRAQALEEAAAIPEAAAAALLAPKRAPQVDRHCAYVLESQAASIRALKEQP